MDDLCARIEAGEASSVASVAEIEALPPGTELVYVERLDDAMAAALSRCQSLRAILLDGSPSITDQGVASLGTLRHLEWLDLEWSERLSNQALLEIERMRSLQYLDIGFCDGITKEAISKLQRSRPDLRIELSGS